MCGLENSTFQESLKVLGSPPSKQIAALSHPRTILSHWIGWHTSSVPLQVTCFCIFLRSDSFKWRAVSVSIYTTGKFVPSVIPWGHSKHVFELLPTEEGIESFSLFSDSALWSVGYYKRAVCLSILKVWASISSCEGKLHAMCNSYTLRMSFLGIPTPSFGPQKHFCRLHTPHTATILYIRSLVLQGTWV